MDREFRGGPTGGAIIAWLVVAACNTGKQPNNDSSTGATSSSSSGGPGEGITTSGGLGTSTEPTSTGLAGSTGIAESTGKAEGTDGSSGEGETSSGTTTGQDLLCGGPLIGVVDNPGCSIWTEEPCAPDEKCMPFEPTPGCYDCDYDFKCFPIVDDPGGPGEACDKFAQGGDSCGPKLSCGDGICSHRCGCDLGEPTCPYPNSYCQEGNTYNLCVVFCDPLALDCPEGWPLCERGYGQFYCNASNGMIIDELHASCAWPQQCAQGMECRDAPQCEGGEDCCVAFCDVDDPQCPLPGQTCEPYIFGGEPPEDIADVGLCYGP